jgi:hypothetical protein
MQHQRKYYKKKNKIKQRCSKLKEGTKLLLLQTAKKKKKKTKVFIN